jgi:transcription-repair coupling factor (superfamily II helicase)
VEDGRRKTQSETRNTQHATRNTETSSAHIPFTYISDARQRIEIYRKLAQATDKSSVQALEKELRDRFGQIPKPLQLLLQLAELRILSAEKNVSVIEVKEDRLMLTRNNDFIMVGSKFPRLTKTSAAARLTEIRKLLLAL